MNGIDYFLGVAGRRRIASVGIGLCLAGVVLGGGCSRSDGPTELRTERRATAPDSLQGQERLTLAQRLGFGPRVMRGGTGMEPSAAKAAPAGPAPAPAMVWKAPEGWRQADDRPMRLVTFFSKAYPEVECYVTLLPGMAGGLDANFNRWCRQMGQATLTEEQINNLPRVPMLGHEAPLLELRGDYQGMVGESQPDSLLLAAAVIVDSGSVFVKLVGSVAGGEAEKAAFLAFCASLAMPTAL